MANVVKFKIPEREIGKADIDVMVYKEASKREGRELLGTLKISKGNLEWAVPHARGSKASNYQVNWKKVPDMMKKEAAKKK